MQGGHPGCRCMLTSRPLCGLPEPTGQLLGDVLARQVMGLPGHPARVLVPAGGVELGHQGDQGAGEQGGVDVHPGQVDHRAPGGTIELLAGGQPVVVPLGLVPAVPHDGAATQLPGPRGQEVEQRLAAGDTAQVEAEQGHARRGVMDVGVDEGRCHQRTIEVDHGVGGVTMHLGSRRRADPDDLPVDDQHGTGPRHRRRVDGAPVQEQPHLCAPARRASNSPRMALSVRRRSSA